MRELKNKKLELDYPCSWIYKVIVKNENDIYTAVKEIIKEREYSLKISNISKKNNFKSFTLELIVIDEYDRKILYETLCSDDRIKMVL